MTFTVDSCIIVAVANRFDSHHKRSRILLSKREDNLVLLIAIATEAISTYIKKFNRASGNVVRILDRASGSPDFVSVFDVEFRKVVTSKPEGSIANFYLYVYALIEEYLGQKDFKKITYILQDHSKRLATLISERVNSLKKVEKTIFPDESTAPDRKRIESIITTLRFSEGADRNNFVVLCEYSKGKELDYFTTDRDYYLKMIKSLNVIRKVFDTGLCPQFLTDSYVASLQ